MFKGNQGLSLERGPIDISYRDPGAWPDMTPGGTIKALTFDFGDPVAGPSVQLGLIRPMEGETLDWKHGRDPVHHHGSDQFRVISGGEWDLAGRTIPAGGYAFQEAGWVYQEHPGDEGLGWVMLVMGDRRGTAATLRFAADEKTFSDAHEGMSDAYADDYTPAAAEDYPHPAGNKGIAAIATTKGECEWGYLLGRIAEVADDGHPDGVAAVTGVLGDPAVGPVVHVLKSGPDQVAIPACVYPTELLLVVVAGSCRVGSKDYRAGDLRIQPANESFGPVTSGPDGLEAVLVIADRRARPDLNESAPSPWMHDVDVVLSGLEPRPGGFQRRG